MKLIFVALFVACASAQLEVDWSNVAPVVQLLKQNLDSFKPASEALAPERRIVNGEAAAPHQFPYQVRHFFYHMTILE